MTVNKLCNKCRYADGERCACPDIEQSIWAYIPEVDSFQNLQKIYRTLNQQALQAGDAVPLLCPAVAEVTGRCKHFDDSKE